MQDTTLMAESEKELMSLLMRMKEEIEKAGLKQSWERMELEESTCMTSDYTTKLQSSRQYGTGTQTEI